MASAAQIEANRRNAQKIARSRIKEEGSVRPVATDVGLFRGGDGSDCGRRRRTKRGGRNGFGEFRCVNSSAG
jgi:hypothetical protein